MFLREKKYRPIRSVLQFIILLMSFHYLYIWWGNTSFYPIKGLVDKLFVFASDILFNQSVWIVDHIFNLSHYTKDQTIWIESSMGNYGYVKVSPECTSLKQWMHWVFLMVFFPGPWKHKAWVIPLGIVVIHFVNIIRIVGLSLVMVPWPQHFHFFHDYIFKTFFYFMIFMLWVAWVEWFAYPKKEARKNNEDND